MNAILGFTEVLKRGYGKPEADRQKYLDTIRSSGEQLLQLINNLLDLSKVESGRLEIEQIRFAPHTLIQEVLLVLAVKADEKALSLDFVVEDPIPETLLSDPKLVRQIVTNLVSNAIKFTEAGGVKVQASLLSSGAAPKLRIAVIDSGIGVPEQSLESIFEPFVQADSSITRRLGGTGLGLAVSRRFARLLGGDIVARSVPGEGTTFEVTLDAGPLEGVRTLEPEEAMRATTPPVAEESGSWKFPPTRVLVVDDGEENRDLLRLVLEEVGLEVEEAENGQIAADKARASSFDIILMDMQMPVMDGYAATRLLREQGLETPIFALTADAMKGFERECLEVGCTGFLTKPVDIDGLFEKIAEVVGGERCEAAAPAASDERAMPPAATPFSEDEPVVSRLASNPRFHPIIGKFVVHLHQKLDGMDASFEAGDMAELAGLAHWLKGSGGSVGYDAFNEPAARLDLAAKEGKLEEIDACLRELRSLADRIEVPSGDGG